MIAAYRAMQLIQIALPVSIGWMLLAFAVSRCFHNEKTRKKILLDAAIVVLVAALGLVAYTLLLAVTAVN